MDLNEQKTLAQHWFRSLRDDICTRFETLEDELASDRPAGRFERQAWGRPEGGGGEMSIMKGRVFEKVGVNISTVHGTFSNAFRGEIPGADTDPHFWASGISLVAHLHSPLVPAAHFNTRMIVTGNGKRVWFGGGGDLNPMYPIDTDTNDFHAAFQTACDGFHPEFHGAFKGWCDEYFYIPHRNIARGVGGIFYDYLGLNHLGHDQSPVVSGRFGKGGVTQELTKAGMELAANYDAGWNTCFDFTKKVGEAFGQIYPELIARHMNATWTPEQREWQLQKRGYYAEYNLLYDRGTRFGLMTGGNVEAILMSLPPEAKWP